MLPDYKALYKTPDLSTYIDAAIIASTYVANNAVVQMDSGNYRLCTLNQKEVRPYLRDMYDVNGIGDLREIVQLRSPTAADRIKLNKSAYSIQKSLELYLDAFGETQSNRKIVGHLFEGLIQAIAEATGTVSTHSGTFKTNVGTLSFDKVFTGKGQSTKKVIVATKTSTKDRASMMFTDKVIYRQFIADNATFAAIILNDVQRTKGGISSTFLPGHHAMYSQTFGPMDGHYYLDGPTAPRFESLDRFIFDDLPTWI